MKSNKGEMFKRSTLVTICSALRLFFQEDKSRKTHFNILGDGFDDSAPVFKAFLRKCRKEDTGTITHKEGIEKGDIEKMYQHPLALWPDTPHGLLNKVWVPDHLVLLHAEEEAKTSDN